MDLTITKDWWKNRMNDEQYIYTLLTNKELINFLMTIKGYCSRKSRCERCKYYSQGYSPNGFCEIREVLKYLVSYPVNSWRADELERIINK